MKSVLMSIHPEYCRKIFSGEKTIEFRRAFKRTDEPVMVFVYETKHGNMGGKVVGYFFCNYIDTLFWDSDIRWHEYFQNKYPEDKDRRMDNICRQGCLSFQELKDYADGKDITMLYIEDPMLFDRPKELSEFGSLIKTIDWERGTVNFFKGNKFYKPMKRPPVSWCYVEEIES